MGTVSIVPAGQVGIIADINPAELPANAWSAGFNVQFINGALSSVLDPSVLISGLISQPIWALPTMPTLSGLACWIVGTPTKLYGFVTGILTDISRVSGGAYTGAATTRWSGAVLSGVTLANNGVDHPQVWMSPNIAVPAVNLPNWPTGVTCASLRSFKQYLVALDVTKAGNRFPTLVKWSHPADPGAIPASWDEADPTKDAGEYPLSETSGHCVDCVALKDINVIYKSDSVWGMQFIGGTFVFKFYKIFGDFGMPSRDCAVEYQSGKHFVFTGTDLRVHDGQTSVSVVTGKMQKLIKNLSSAQLRSCHVALNALAQEVWFCYRRSDDGLFAVDTALVYSWTDGTLSLRELPDYRFLANGRLDPPVTGVITWGNATGTWASHTEEWGEAQIIPSTVRLLGLGDKSVEWLEASQKSSGRCWVERTYLGIPIKAQQAPDLTTQKFLSRFYPRFVGTPGDVVYITVGTSDSPAEPIVWRAPVQFIIGVSRHVDCTVIGKMLALRIESLNVNKWAFNGLDADVVPAGSN